MPRILLASIAAVALAAGPALAATVHTTVQVATPTGPGAALGTVTITDSPQGAVITVDLHSLPPGQRGMHIHERGSCAPSKGADGNPVAAGAAGGHFDPAGTDHHMGPEGQGHLGDLPRLEVAADGSARRSLTAPRIKDVTILKGRTLIVHAGGDTYGEPPPLGGGGARIACGILE